MKRRVMTVMTAAFLAMVCAVPAFAHCHGGNRSRSYHHEYVCQSYCEGGYVCGVDGHYCEIHRDGDVCQGYGTCAPVSSNHHHHGR